MLTDEERCAVISFSNDLNVVDKWTIFDFWKCGGYESAIGQLKRKNAEDAYDRLAMRLNTTKPELLEVLDKEYTLTFGEV